MDIPFYKALFLKKNVAKVIPYVGVTLPTLVKLFLNVADVDVVGVTLPIFHLFKIKTRVKTFTSQTRKRFCCELLTPFTQVRRCNCKLPLLLNGSIEDNFIKLQHLIIILWPLPAQSCISSITLTSAPSDTIFLTIPGNILPLYFTTTQFSSDKVPSSMIYY